MKGYVELLLGWLLVLILYVSVSYYVDARLKYETKTSDAGAQTYQAINAIEFAKLNSQQALKFSVQQTEKDLQLKFSDIQNNNQLQSGFLDRLKKNYNPSQDYSDVDVSVTVLSLSIDVDKVVARNQIESSSQYQKISVVADITSPLS